MKGFIYQVTPIQTWVGAIHINDLIRFCYKYNNEITAERMYARIMETLERAQEDVDLEGTIREGPFVFFIPIGIEMEPCFAWRQGDNNCTFVWSGVPLEYLKEVSV